MSYGDPTGVGEGVVGRDGVARENTNPHRYRKFPASNVQSATKCVFLGKREFAFRVPTPQISTLFLLLVGPQRPPTHYKNSMYSPPPTPT